MKTLMIDNSLCRSHLDKDIKAVELIAYMESLLELGCSYIEMVTETFLLLPPGQDVSKIILRVNSEEDLLYVNSFDFPYVLLPANLAHFAPKVQRPLIAEFYLHGSGAFELLDMFSRALDLSNFDMIRLADNFSDSKEKMKKLLTKLHKEYTWSFDICPLNRNATAVSAAVSAYLAEAECVTMRFGSRRTFAEIQDFTLTFANLYGVLPTPEAVMALCRCNALYHLIFGTSPDSDLDAMRRFQIIPHRCAKADDPTLFRDDMALHNMACAANSRHKEYTDILYDKLRSMRVDGETAEELVALINSYCAKLFNN